MFALWVVLLVVCYCVIKRQLRKLKIGSTGDKYVFITGCDTGFGHRLAQRLDGLGFHVIAACFTEKGADETKKGASSRLVTLSNVNVTDENSITKAFDKVKTLLPPNKGLWAIVNNAGVAGTPGYSEWMTRKDYNDVLAVNLFGVIDVTRIFMPLIRKEKGRIVNIASLLGRIAMVPVAYTISKYGVEAFSDVIRRELYHQGISVHILEPGYFKTNIIDTDTLKRGFNRAFNQSPEDVQKYYGKDFLKNAIDTVDSVRDHVASSNIDEVVDVYIHAVSARFPKHRYIVGRDAKYVFRLIWNLPEWMSDWILNLKTPKPAGERA